MTPQQKDNTKMEKTGEERDVNAAATEDKEMGLVCEALRQRYNRQIENEVIYKRNHQFLKLAASVPDPDKASISSIRELTFHFCDDDGGRIFEWHDTEIDLLREMLLYDDEQFFATASEKDWSRWFGDRTGGKFLCLCKRWFAAIAPKQPPPPMPGHQATPQAGLSANDLQQVIVALQSLGMNQNVGGMNGIRDDRSQLIRVTDLDYVFERDPKESVLWWMNRVG